jgi:hypothetical protein
MLAPSQLYDQLQAFNLSVGYFNGRSMLGRWPLLCRVRNPLAWHVAACEAQNDSLFSELAKVHSDVLSGHYARVVPA